ncbi:hypothetical protein pb186bvf_014021 [Paramecium bursaria]
MNQDDCAKSLCNWTDRCQDYECNQVRNYTLCALIDHCAWDQYQCQDFTQCSDYFSNDNASCHIQGPRCLTSNISSQCMDDEISKYRKNYIGYNCSKLSASLCNKVNGCVYKSQQCQLQTCEDIQTQENFIIWQTCVIGMEYFAHKPLIVHSQMKKIVLIIREVLIHGTRLIKFARSVKLIF